MSAGMLSEGTVFAGRYRVVRCIAAGGMGAVYEVIHLETQRRRALKVMHPQFLQSDELRGRFRQEARVAANVESRHIVDVFDAGIDETTGMPFLVMELLRGEELGKRLVRVKRFAPAEILLYLHQTALALDKTHRAHIVHRDLKPDNLFLCEHDDGPATIKVLDFGIAKLVAEGSTQANATRSLGTPLYMAPEQFRSAAAVSPATDIFALGMIAYTLLVGVTYWLEDSKLSDNVFAFAAAASGGPREPASARALRQGVTLPASFDAWFARATAFSPADRFPSASAAVQALAFALGLPQPGQERTGSGTVDARMTSNDSRAAATGPSTVALVGSVASTVPEGGSRGTGTVPAGQAEGSMGLGVPSTGPGTGTEMMPSEMQAMAMGGSGPVTPVPILTPMPTGTSPIPSQRRRHSGITAMAISAVVLLAGGAAFYYGVASPRRNATASDASAAAAVEAAAPVAPEPKPVAPVVVVAPPAAPPATAAAFVTPVAPAAAASIHSRD